MEEAICRSATPTLGTAIMIAITEKDDDDFQGIIFIYAVYTLDRFIKTFFWNFQSIPADLCYILIYKQMLEKVFCSNIAPSLSSGNHLFYKAEYMGQSCPNQVWAITFDWSALAT